MNDENQIMLDRAQKMNPRVSNSMFLRLFLMLIPFLAYSISLHCTPATHDICSAGQAWRCQNCHTYQWQDSQRKDWAGVYRCTHCGAQR